jgi:hypothetical protein
MLTALDAVYNGFFVFQLMYDSGYDWLRMAAIEFISNICGGNSLTYSCNSSQIRQQNP